MEKSMKYIGFFIIGAITTLAISYAIQNRLNLNYEVVSKNEEQPIYVITKEKSPTIEYMIKLGEKLHSDFKDYNSELFTVHVYNNKKALELETDFIVGETSEEEDKFYMEHYIGRYTLHKNTSSEFMILTSKDFSITQNFYE